MILPLWNSEHRDRVRTASERTRCTVPGCFFIAVLLWCSSFAIQASDTAQVSGFGTLGLSVEREEDLAFLRDSNQSKDPEKDGSLHPDSILGVQFSAPFSDQWRATTQFVYRDRPKQTLGEATELAFLGYRPIPDLDIRVGRMAVDMFQLSDYRRVDYVNLWVRPPTEVYGWILPSSIDGADVAYNYSHGDYFWRLKMQAGDTEPRLEFPDGSAQVQTEFNDFLVATLTLDVGFWRSRVSYSQSKTAASVPGFVAGLQQVAAFVPGPVGAEAAAFANRLQSASDRQVRYTQASLGYDNGEWLLDMELSRLSTSGALVPTGTAGYLSVGYRSGAFTPYVVYARFLSDQEPTESTADWSLTPFEGLRDAALGTFNGVLIEQYTHSLGLRWDVAPKMALKAQWDRTQIEKEQFALWAHRNGRADRDATVNVFSFALNFIF